MPHRTPSFRGLLEATGENQTWLLRIAWVQPSQSLPQAVNSCAQRDCLTYPRPQQANSILEQMWSLLTSNLVLLKGQGSSWPSFFSFLLCQQPFLYLVNACLFLWIRGMCLLKKKKLKRQYEKKSSFKLSLPLLRFSHVCRDILHLNRMLHAHTWVYAHTHTHTPQIPKRS